MSTYLPGKDVAARGHLLVTTLGRPIVDYIRQRGSEAEPSILPGGKSLNWAWNVLCLMGEGAAAVICRVGNDPLGRAMIGVLWGAGADVSGVTYVDGDETSSCEIIVPQDGGPTQCTTRFADGSVPTINDIRNSRDLLMKSRTVIIDFCLPEKILREVLTHSPGHRIGSLRPNKESMPRRKSYKRLLRGLDTLLINEREATSHLRRLGAHHPHWPGKPYPDLEAWPKEMDELKKRIETKDDPVALARLQELEKEFDAVMRHAAQTLAKVTGGEPIAGRPGRVREGRVTVTVGARGTYYCGQSGHVDHFPPDVVVKVVDPTGAGDAFTAAYAVAVARGKSVEEAIKAGDEYGARAVQVWGAQVVTGPHTPPEVSQMARRGSGSAGRPESPLQLGGPYAQSKTAQLAASGRASQ